MKRTLFMILLLVPALLAFAGQYTVGGAPNQVSLVSSTPQSSILEMTLGHFNREEVNINGTTYWALNLDREGITQETGLPQVPYLSRSLAIPGTAKMQVRILDSEYTEVTMPVVPSKGILTRDIDPDTVPWVFAPFYQGGGFYPDELARLSEPFIIRDYRGITVHFQPFVYYPATQTLRIYTRIRLAVDNAGSDTVNIITANRNSASAWFENIYQGLFLNYNQAKYPVLDEQGRMLIITNSMFDASLQPFVEWKRQKGFTVDVVDITVAGPTATQLKTYIQNQYDLNTDLAFVQIIGDHAQVPSLTSGSGASDPSFTLLAGTDSYPEIFIGRFSAQTTAELDTQILRTVRYERDMQSDNAWLSNAIGIASAEGGGSQGDMGESDIVHMNYIRTDLLTYGYGTVDQIYDPGASAAAVSASVNAGRGFINYVGHGSSTTWVTTGFSNTNVGQLTNDNKLPFIVSVACVNGNFANSTCFAESWLRARDSVTGNPRGAVVFYGSTINQSWNSPMRAQDEITDLLVAHQKNTIGGLYFNGSSKMIEVYGTDGANMFKTWHIFGDASLQVRTVNPLPLTAQYMPILYLGLTSYTVQTVPGAWVSLYADGVLYGSAFADASGSAVINLSLVPAEPMNLTLTITAFDHITLIDTIQVVPNDGPYLQVAAQVVSDGDNNLPEFGESFTYDLTLNNVGSVTATGIAVTISTADPYITITDNAAVYDSIPAGQAVTSAGGFAIQAANNVPDQHAALIHVSISRYDSLAWEYEVSLILNSPVLATGALQVNDSQGNNNGRLDAGETARISIPVTNNGHAPAADLLCSLFINNQYFYLLEPVQTTFPLVEPGQTVEVMFDLTFSSQIPVGAPVEFMLIGISGEFTILQVINTFIGLVIESFDSGTFTAFPWTFTGGNWSLDTSTFYGGSASAKSALIANSGSTAMQVVMEVPAASNISFWKKVSSEQNYDFLKFYINGVLKEQWSGESVWTQHSYPVPAGTTTFKWEYAKDYMATAGSDCAWVDEIAFPGVGGIQGVPVISVLPDMLDFGSHTTADFEPLPFAITNSGEATLIGTITGSDAVRIKPAQEEVYAQTLNFVIPAGITMNFDVMVFPAAEGNFSGELHISCDDPAHPASTVPVTAIVLPVGNDEQVSALVTQLRGNYPNPFRSETNVHFSLKQEGQVTLEVYNLLGQKVATLYNDKAKAGNYTYKWSGRDDAGRSVGSGIYFLRMRSGSYQGTSKMILMK